MGYIYLIRHGEVSWNSEGAYIGSTDLPLNDTGRLQAILLADRLKIKKLSTVYSSNLSRAFETAQIIAAPHGLNVVSDERLREINYGGWEGLSAQQIMDKYPEAFSQWRKNASKVTIPGGESMSQMLERAYTAFMEITLLHKDDDIAIIAHKIVNRTILCKLLDMPVENYRIIGQDNSCVNTMHIKNDDSIVVDTINDRCHLRK